MARTLSPRTTARRVSSSFVLTGPFFEKDPALTFRQNVRGLMDQIADIGEADVKAQLTAGQSTRAPMRLVTPNRVAAHVVGRTKNLAGQRWAVTAVVSVNNSGLSKAQGIQLMAAASRLEGQTGAFKRSNGRMRKASKLNDLTKGIA